MDGTARFALFIIVFFTGMKGSCKKENFSTLLSPRLNRNAFFVEPRNVRIEKNLKKIEKKKEKEKKKKHSFPGNKMAFVSLRGASEAYVIA